MPNTSPSKINPLLPRLPGWSLVPGRCQMTEITRSPGSRSPGASPSPSQLSNCLHLWAVKGCCVLLTRADMMTRLLHYTEWHKIRKKVKIHFYAYFQFKSRDGRGVCGM